MSMQRGRILTVIGLVSAICSSCLGQLPPGFLHGGDVSEIPEVEAAEGEYFYHGKHEDPFVIMREAGWNFVRLRIWNHPKDAYCDKAHTLAMAVRAKAQGLKISLDFHYSDWWADPGKQTKPAAWKSLPFDKLVQATYEYTKEVVAAMIAQDTRPYMVQNGKEILGGMLWPDGHVTSDDEAKWKQLAQLLNAGLRAVHDAQGSERILTMIHLDRGGDNKTAVWWFNHILKERVKFDAIGLSYYPFWHGGLEAMQSNVNDLARRYRKDIYIVETGYPWSIDSRSTASEHVKGDARGILAGYPPTPEGQNAFLKKVLEIIQQIPRGKGKGLLYWAPTWISPDKKPTPYDNLALFNYNGDSLPSVDTMGGRGP